MCACTRQLLGTAISAQLQEIGERGYGRRFNGGGMCSERLKLGPPEFVAARALLRAVQGRLQMAPDLPQKRPAVLAVGMPRLLCVCTRRVGVHTNRAGWDNARALAACASPHACTVTSALRQPRRGWAQSARPTAYPHVAHQRHSCAVRGRQPVRTTPCADAYVFWSVSAQPAH
eukprot:365347-Chlamydomonas_euryale.AAC.18